MDNAAELILVKAVGGIWTSLVDAHSRLVRIQADDPILRERLKELATLINEAAECSLNITIDFCLTVPFLSSYDGFED